MSLTEIITLEIGSTIAKSIFTLWLKDKPILSDISSSIVDIIKSRITNIFDQRQIQREFEAIGDEVGKSLIPLFENEGAHLDKGSQIAIAKAVAHAFEKSQLSSNLLATLDLDPGKVTNYVISKNLTSTELFSETEESLYHRTINEACKCIISIASHLPSFNEYIAAEILKRDNQLLIIVNNVLQEVLRMREQSNPTLGTERFEADYRWAVTHKLDFIELFGTDVSPTSRRHRLSIAYITLLAEQKSPSTPDIEDIVSPNELIASKDLESVTNESVKSVDQALANSSRILIRGSAGSGKTTLLQWIAVKSALSTFSGVLSNWNNTIPFYIRLRQFAKSELPLPEKFPISVASTIADKMPKGWVHAVLEAGHAIVLIDGLDEVPELQRHVVREWLKELLDNFPKNRFIITSRPHAVKEKWLNNEGFTDAELQPMRLIDIYNFIDHWHNAIQEGIHDDEEKEAIKPLAMHLKESVKESRSLRNLATIPLLCAMLCALHRDRRQQIPSDRIELYEACCRLLIEGRDKERQIDLADYPNLTYRHKLVLLKDLAYWLIKNSWSEIELSEVDARFAKKLDNIPDIQKNNELITGTNVRRLLVERTGIIREPITDKIDFTHRTFQEYLAAKAALDEGDIGVLIEHASNDQWREVIILASGLATTAVREKLILELISHGDKDQKHRYQLHLLAVSCLETIDELGQTIKSEVEKRLSKLVPPRNMTDAKALASAGELAITYLIKNKQYNTTVTTACIRTLAIIGGERALATLEHYAFDNRLTVIDELYKSWDYFDKERTDYAKIVLSHIQSNIITMKIQQIRPSTLEGFQHFTQIKDLDLNSCENITDLSPLSNLTQLTSLNLARCWQVTDLSPLSNLTQLTSLNLTYCQQVTDLSLLSNLTQLTSLDLARCQQVTDLSPLSNLIQLTSLDLARCQQVTDLSPLSNLTQLTSLDLTNYHRITDLNLLSNLTQLTSLNLACYGRLLELIQISLQPFRPISQTNLTRTLLDAGISNLTDVRNLAIRPEIKKQMQGLDEKESDTFILNTSHITDLSPLSNLAQLTSLNLMFCENITDLSPLSNLAQLTSLNLAYCQQVTDLSPLSNLTQLTSLNLTYCQQATDLSPLSNLTQLTSLILAHCQQVTDLNLLSNLTQLTSLDLTHNKNIFDINILDELQKLRTLRIDYMPNDLISEKLKRATHIRRISNNTFPWRNIITAP